MAQPADSSGSSGSVATGSGIRVGRFLGIPIFADVSLFITGALVAYGFLPRLEYIDPSIGSRKYLVAIGFAILLYLSILVHELAHAAVARSFGLPVRSVSLSMLGGATALDRKPDTPGRDFAVSGAGPAATLLIAGLGWAAMQVAPQGGLVYLVLLQLTWSNVIVGIYNLLPGLPLDGGSMLAAVVWRVTGRELSGQIAAGWVGRVVAVLTAAAPFLVGWYEASAPSTIFVVWAAVIAYFLWAGSTQSLRAAKVRARLPQLALRGLVRPALLVTATTPLAEALRQVGEARAGAMVTTDSEGTPTGIVSEAAVVAVPPERRPWIPVNDVARPLAPGLLLDVELGGQALLEAMGRAPATEYLVVDATGRVVGVLAATDLERLFSDV
jgi:Zn-dependent protease/CBS domain-containing protein